MTKRLVSLGSITLALLGCGGSAPPAESPKPSAAPQPASKADQCLKEAALPREPQKDAPEHITVSHVLVRHEDLKNPQGATRSKGDACLRAEQARQKILGGEERGTAGHDQVARPAREPQCEARVDTATGHLIGSIGWSRPIRF
jgi:hypothetical protein